MIQVLENPMDLPFYSIVIQRIYLCHFLCYSVTLSLYLSVYEDRCVCV